jgi:DNA-binding NtrC family response regulator
MSLPRSPDTPNAVDLKKETASTNILNPKNSRVLLIEDDPLVADLTIAMLNSTGREVEWFDSCRVFTQELPTLDLEQFELAVIDLTLGDGSGLDAAFAMHSYQPNMPVVLVSGYDAVFGNSLDLDIEFLAKPYNRDQLQNSMEKAIDRISKKE